MTDSKRAFVTVAVPRTGSNYLQDLMGAFPDVVSLMEVFHSQGVYGLGRYPRLLASFGDKVDGRLDQSERLVRYFAEKSVAAIDTLSLAIARDEQYAVFSFKVFPDQVFDNALDEIFLRHAAGVIVLVRPRLETFVSYKKAEVTGAWHTVDTSRIKVSVDLAEFHALSQEYDRWYERIERFLIEKRIPHTIWSYGADINVAREAVVEKLYYTLRSMGHAASMPQGPLPTLYCRQDTHDDVFDKFRNGRQLKAELARSGLLGYALSCPLSG